MTNNTIPLVDLTLQYNSLKQDIDKNIQDTLRSGHFIQGAAVENFEKKFASFIGVKHCIGVASGTDALHLSLIALGIGKGDEVIVPANTFIASAYAVLYVDAKPVFVDIDANTYNIDLALAEKSITNKTRAIIPVHLYGQPVEMPEVIRLAKKYNLFIIEDACQAHGATYNKKHVGSFGTLAAFSFYPSKNLGCYGDGGAITTNSSRLASKLRKLREYGSTEKYKYKFIGLNSRLDAIQACILETKLIYLKAWNSKKLILAHYYDKKFKEELPHIKIPYIRKGVTSAYHLYVIRTAKRNKLIKYLNKHNIQTGIHYPIPLHLQESLKHLGYKKGDFPTTELLSNQILSLPFYPELTFKQQDIVIQAMKAFFNNL